jgi:hypothetical protein
MDDCEFRNCMISSWGLKISYLPKKTVLRGRYITWIGISKESVWLQTKIAPPEDGNKFKPETSMV